MCGVSTNFESASMLLQDPQIEPLGHQYTNQSQKIFLKIVNLTGKHKWGLIKVQECD